MNPEIEEKLLNLQRLQEKHMKGDQQSITSIPTSESIFNDPSKSNYARKRISIRTDDDDWLGETPKRRPARSSGSPENNCSLIDSTFECENTVQNAASSPSEYKTPKEDCVDSKKTPEKCLSNRQIAAIKREQKKKIELKRQVHIL